MAQRFLSDIHSTAGFKDSSGDLGTNGQGLSSTGSGTNWINQASGSTAINLDNFTGNGSATAFTLGQTPPNENVTQVYIDGVYQEKGTYSISGTTLTFSTAPPNSSGIEVISFETITSSGGTLTATTFSGDLSGTINTATTATTQSAGNNSTKVATTAYADAKVADAINNGTTAIAPSQNAVFDALALKANLAGPTFTGTPAAPTASAGTNTTQLATTAFVTTGIANIVDSSPAALNTLNELAAALGDDANFSTTVTNSIATKAPLASPTFSGTVGMNVAPASTRTLLVKGQGTSSSTAPFQINDGNNADILVIKDDKSATFTGIVNASRYVATGQNTSHTASSIKISQESSALSEIRCYGADASTQGTFRIELSASDGSPSATALAFDSSANATFSGDIALTGDSKIQATADLGIGARNGTTNAGAVYIGGANDNPFISPTAFFGTDGKVGIGTTSPTWKLTVSDGTITGFINPFNSYFNVGAATSHGLKLYAGGDARVTISSGGQIGMNVAPASTRTLLVKGQGTSSSTAPFQVNDGNNADILVIKDDKSSTFAGNIILPQNGVVAFNSTSDEYITASADHLFFGTGNLARLTIDGANVGIGTTSPSAKLEIVGSAHNQLIIKDSASSIQLGADDSVMIGVTMVESASSMWFTGPHIPGATGITSSFNFARYTGSWATHMSITSGGDIAIPRAFNNTTNAIIYIDSTISSGASTYQGSLLLQAGGAGSASYGAGLRLYGHAHASSPGSVEIGLSAVSGAKFTVDSYGAGGGTDIFTVERNTFNVYVTNGNLIAGSTSDVTGTHYFNKGASVNGGILYAGSSTTGRFSLVVQASDMGYNNTPATCLKIGGTNSTSRSISAAGTVNVSGNDYAEYMTKAINDVISKGDVVGVDSDGLLTNIFNDAISFVIKSTDPSFVGGDIWGIESEDKDKIEEARIKVDRIAFSGQVPCNVKGASVGDYIIPVASSDGKITGEAVSNPTFEQYKISVGKVWKIMNNGNSWVAVKIG